MKTKKELKEEYNLLKQKAGVFRVTNMVNGKIFIDSSVNLDKIWNRHRVELNFGNHRNVDLQNDWKQFGEPNFKFEILSEIQEEEGKNINYDKEAKSLAKMFIEELQPFGDKGYN